MIGMPSGTTPDPSARRRPRVRTIVASLAVVGVAAALLVSCSQMTIASIGAGAGVRAAVGDAGEVTTHVVERKINVTPVCQFRVRLKEGLAAGTAEDVLTRVWASTGGSTCTVATVEFGNRSTVRGYPSAPMDAQAAAAVVAAAISVPRVSLSLERADGVRGVFASVYTRDGDFASAAALVRGAATATDALEEAFGPVAWSVDWDRESGPRDAVTIQADDAVLPALSSALDGIAAIRDSGEAGTPSAAAVADLDAAITGVFLTAVFVGGDETIGVGLTVEGWSAADLEARQAAFVADSRAAAVAASIMSIIEESGLPRPTITANETVELGAPDD